MTAGGLILGLVPWSIPLNKSRLQPNTFIYLDPNLHCGGPLTFSQSWVAPDGTSCAAVYFGAGLPAAALIVTGIVFFIRWLYMMVGREVTTAA